MNIEREGAEMLGADFSQDGERLLVFGSDNFDAVCPVPRVVLQNLKKSPPPPFSKEKKEKYSIGDM